jgi:hypothetical protein
VIARFAFNHISDSIPVPARSVAPRAKTKQNHQLQKDTGGIGMVLVNPALHNRCCVCRSAITIIALAASLAFGARPLISQVLPTEPTKDWKLSPAEANAAIKLAARVGLTNVVKIGTSDFGEISLTGPELIIGRDISFVSVHVEKDRTAEPPWFHFNFTKILCSDGQYCVLVGGVRTNKLTLFEFKGRTIRVELASGMTLARADSLVGLLVDQKIRYLDEEARVNASAVDLSKPSFIGQRDGMLSIGFSCGEGCDLMLRCKIENDTIVVKRYSKFIACG